jgi:hypothetical protein
MDTRLSSKRLRALKVGDGVRIHLGHVAAAKGIKPKDVVITAVHEPWNIDVNGKIGLPIVEWQEGGAVARCNASYVTDILSVAPYRSIKVATNTYHRSIYKDAAPLHASGKCVAESPIGLADRIAAEYEHLDIPFGFSEDRLFAVWAKAGHPGLRGSYHFYANKLSATHMPWRPVEPLKGVDDDIFDYGTIWWIHVPTFRNWLLRALPHVVRTRKEFIQDGIALAQYDEEQFQRDLDMDQESSRSMRYGT